MTLFSDGNKMELGREEEQYVFPARLVLNLVKNFIWTVHEKSTLNNNIKIAVETNDLHLNYRSIEVQKISEVFFWIKGVLFTEKFV